MWGQPCNLSESDLPPFADVVINGTIFWDSTKRYEAGLDVVCDRCRVHGMTRCYSKDNYDLCFMCCGQILTIMADAQVKVPSSPRAAVGFGGGRTRMLQAAFQAPEAPEEQENVTLMFQNSMASTVDPAPRQNPLWNQPRTKMKQQMQGQTKMKQWMLHRDEPKPWSAKKPWARK